MQVDLNFLRQHYASLSDDAFDAIHPDDLVDDARRIYEEERKQRKRPVASARAQEDGEEQEAEGEGDPGGDDSEPDWLEDAAVATTFYAYGENDAASEAEDARAALEEAGIPCRISAQKPEAKREPDVEYRLLVPAKFNLEAGGVLDQRVFTEDYAEAWKAHFGELTDEELREVNLDAIFGGLRDRIEQVIEAYEQELASRENGVKPRR